MNWGMVPYYSRGLWGSRKENGYVLIEAVHWGSQRDI